MENLEFQKHVLERIQKLEKKSFDGTFEENYGSAKEEAKAISTGKTPEHFIGQRTRESALQRLISFGQNYDEGRIGDLHGNDITKYQREKAICQMLLKKYNITEDEVKHGFQ